MIKIKSKKIGKIVSGFHIDEIFIDDFGVKRAQITCPKCGRKDVVPYNAGRFKKCYCQKEYGKHNGEIIKGFEIINGYCKKSKSGKSKAICYTVRCINCGTFSEKWQNCLFKENSQCRCNCKKNKQN